MGSFRELSLKEARLARDAARLRVKGDRSTPGVDIVAERRAARQRTQAAEIAAAAPTFQQCAEKYIDAQWSGWSEKHRAQWPASLKRYAYPTIGGLTIADIRATEITPKLCALARQCSEKTPSTARSSAGLISLECSTATETSGPSSLSCRGEETP